MGDESEQQSGPHHRELRDTTTQQDAMGEPSNLTEDQYMDDSCSILPLKFISGDDAPAGGGDYAINLLGTTDVLTCVNDTELAQQKWYRFSPVLGREEILFPFLGDHK
ncbi:hypothetical protein ACHAQJ_006168 [Trichoderma viride]